MKKTAETIKVYVPEKDWEKILTYCRIAKPMEIMGLAHAEITPKGDVYVAEPLILKQEVTGATCELDKEELVRFIGNYENIAKVKCVWHSHVDMTAKFSSCDRDTSNTMALLGQMMAEGSSWFLSLVVNCKGEYECVVDMYKPFRVKLDAEIMTLIDKNDALEAEVKELLTVRGSSRKNGGGVTISAKPKEDRESTSYSEDDVFGQLELS